MRVLEVIQPNNDKQQLDEAIFTTLLISAVVGSLGAMAIEAGIGMVKNWADDMDINAGGILTENLTTEEIGSRIFNTFLANVFSVSIFEIFIFFCKIIFPESN